jgi:hypothetical protein
MLREILEGYARANLFIEQEQREALARMMPEEAWNTFQTLLHVWEQSGENCGDLGSLDTLRIKELVQQREKLDRLTSGAAEGARSAGTL